MDENSTIYNNSEYDYPVHTICDASQLMDCPEFLIDQYNWGGTYRPKVGGRLAYLAGKGFLLNMWAEESNPLTTYFQNGDPVYKDSALEFFFSIPGFPETDTYINVEVNSAGAILAHYGNKRGSRTSFPKPILVQFICQPLPRKQNWQINLLIPLVAIMHTFPDFVPNKGTTFGCNFYKISETKEIEHYASYAPIPTQEPNFHLPQYFAHATFV